jgi:hypothetical protein
LASSPREDEGLYHIMFTNRRKFNSSDIFTYLLLTVSSFFFAGCVQAERACNLPTFYISTIL